MKFNPTFVAFTISFFSILFSTAQQKADDNLGTLMTSTGWDALIGTWLNPEGEEFIFSWQYPDTALKMEAEVGGVKRASIYVKRANSDVANAFAFSSDGSSNLGTCTFSKGIAQFVMTYLTDKGETKEMKFKYTLTSEDTFEVKMENSDHIYKYKRK